MSATVRQAAHARHPLRGTRRWLLVPVFFASSVACAGEGTKDAVGARASEPVVAETTADDRPGPGLQPPARDPGADADRASARSPGAPATRARLTGHWRAQVTTSTHGVVLVEAQIMGDGWVFGTAFVRGTPLSRRLRIESFDGQTLRARFEGRTYEVPATLRGDVLRARAPVVGAVRFQRQPGATDRQ